MSRKLLKAYELAVPDQENPEPEFGKTEPHKARRNEGLLQAFCHALNWRPVRLSESHPLNSLYHEVHVCQHPGAASLTSQAARSAHIH